MNPCLCGYWRTKLRGCKCAAGNCGLTRDSHILIDQFLAWDNELFRRDLVVVPEAVQDEVRRALLDFMDLL